MRQRKTTAGSAGNAGAWQRNRWRIGAWTGAALILLLPLAAMQLTDEVNWGRADFAAFGAMLLAVGGIFEAAARTTANAAYRAASGIALATAFVLVWMILAVGIIGSEDNPANMMFGGVLAETNDPLDITAQVRERPSEGATHVRLFPDSASASPMAQDSEV